MNIFSNDRSERWKKELQGAINSSNMDGNGTNYIAQEIELDAFAVTKFYLEKFEGIQVVNKIDKIDQYILVYLKFAIDTM